ncbi:MAG: FeoB-associated Cys-rich membrane protein [Bacteroidales bacterium]|nr:FeoB-associated Cys-rich membrane protein [Bacteroidales bacterium]
MEDIVVYIIVAAAATALALKIRKGIKNKGKCDGCSGCDGCSKANHCNNGQFYCGNK